MEQRTKPRWAGTRDRIGICLFCIALFFTGSAPLAEAATNSLQNQFNSAQPGGVITLAPGQTINFLHTENAILVGKSNLTFRGATSGGFYGTIGNLSGLAGAQGAGIDLGAYQRIIAGWTGGAAYSGALAPGFLSGLSGASAARTLANGAEDYNKWISTPDGTPSAANGLSLRDLRFGEVQVNYDGGNHVNGLIGNDNRANNPTSLGEITGNVFTAIGVTLEGDRDTEYLAGGGVLGVRSTAEPGSTNGSADIRLVSGNIFDGIEILTTNSTGTPPRADINNKVSGSAYLEGGGLIGVNGVSSPSTVVGHAQLGELSNNFFTRIKIGSNDILLGGGLVGVNNNSQNGDESQTYARLGTARGNIFGSGATGDITVTLDDSLRGGGVVGVNGLSNAAATLDTLENNAFAGVTVTTASYLKGGGIVGLQTNAVAQHDDDDKPGIADPNLTPAMARLGSASGNLFLNQKISAGSWIEGGGVIGLRSNRGVASLGALTGNTFKGITVNTGEAETLSGGGVVGLSANTQALMGEDGGIQNNVFDDIHVTIGTFYDDALIGNFLNGGGIIGIHARDVDPTKFNWATMTGINNNSFTNSGVAALSINGGGIIGVNAGGAPRSSQFTAGLSALGSITNNTFDRLIIRTYNPGDPDSGYLEGGGVIGVWNKDSTLDDSNSKYGIAAITTVDNNSFTNIQVDVATHLQGGGIIGIRGSALEQIDSLTRNVFTDNIVTAGNIDGGGVIGVTSRDGTSPYAGIELIGESLFARNDISASGGDVFGGIVYSYGLNNINGGSGMTIRDSQFVGNTLASANGIVYGAVTIDTGAVPMNGNLNTLTLSATPGGSTVFMNNTITDLLSVNLPNAGLPDTRTNSLYFGTIPEPGGADDPAQWDPTLVVNPQAGGVVALYDPIWVNQDAPATGEQATFAMDVQGAGDFIWGGTNVFRQDEDAPAGDVTFAAGSTTTLLDGNSATTFVNGSPISGSHVKTMLLDAPNFTFTLEKGATLNVEGHNRFDLHGDFAADPRTPTVAELNGNLHFNLNNTAFYQRGEVPGDANHLLPDNNARLTAGHTPLLTINVPDSTGMVDVTGSTVSLSDFAAGPKLKDGDRFYLVELDHGVTDGKQVFTGDPANNTASARQGMLTRYTFTIDKNLDNMGADEDTRFLVARLKSAEPAPEFDSPNTGRITGITVLQRVSDRLPELEFFGPNFPAEPYLLLDPCDPDMERDRREARRDPSKWIWSGFGDVKGSWYRADTSNAGYADIRAAHYLGGLAGGRQLDDGHIQAGLFADASHANYDTRNRVRLPEGATTLHGEGEIDTVGGGAFLRRNWNNGFGVDLMVRGGELENEFSSRDILTNGIPAHYKLDTTYLGAGAGVSYEWQYEKNTFDVYGRYSWLRENGGRVRLSTNETVEFKPLDSHRLTGGARLTRQTDLDLAWYIGGAYEHELAGSSRAVERSNGGNMSFDGVSLRGGTGVGEIGLILNPKDNLSVTLGLEGYAGQRDGGSAFASFAWRF